MAIFNAEKGCGKGYFGGILKVGFMYLRAAGLLYTGGIYDTPWAGSDFFYGWRIR